MTKSLSVSWNLSIWIFGFVTLFMSMPAHARDPYQRPADTPDSWWQGADGNPACNNMFGSYIAYFNSWSALNSCLAYQDRKCGKYDDQGDPIAYSYSDNGKTRDKCVDRIHREARAASSPCHAYYYAKTDPNYVETEGYNFDACATRQNDLAAQARRDAVSGHRRYHRESYDDRLEAEAISTRRRQKESRDSWGEWFVDKAQDLVGSSEH